MSSEYTEEMVSEAMEGLPALWVLKHKIKTEAGFPIEFKKRKFLWDMYNDLSPKQVEMKPPQIGLTVKAIVKTIWVAKKLKRDIIYTLPTQGDVEDMASDKINRIIAQNPILQKWINEHDTVSQKSVGNNIIHYRGTFTSKQAMMVSSGLNVHDEVDASDPAVINQYETRLEGQENEDMKWRWYFSHPSIAGQGVDIQWQQSDQKEWYIECPHCELLQTLSWPENIDMVRKVYICQECKGELPDETRINGEWRNKDLILWTGTIAGDYKFSGWHVSQLMLWNKTAEDIINSFNDPTKDQQYFWNYVLGLPYISSDDRIEASVVLRNCIDKVNPRTARTIIGCDTGHGLHYVLMNKEGVFFYENVTEITATKDPYDVIRGHLKRFERSIAVFDQGGDLIGVRKLVQEYPGRIFLCFYNKDRKTVEFVEWSDDSDTEWWKVRVDRNRFMTLMVEQLRDVGRIPLNGTKDEWAEFASHFGYLYREKLLVKEARGKDNRELYGAEYVWKRKGPDHFCFVPGTLITTEQGDIPIESVRIGQKVLTRVGYQIVTDNFIGEIGAKVVTAYFSNGSSFIATPDHPIVTQQGKVKLDSTRRDAILYSCKGQKVLYSRALLIGGTPTHLLVPNDFTIPPMVLNELKGQRGFISKYGLMPIVLFLQAMSFITKMVMHSIMSLQTFSAYRAVTISDNMQEKDSKTVSMLNVMRIIWLKSDSNLMHGGRLMKARNGTARMLWAALYCVNRGLLTVLSAVLGQLHAVLAVVSSVPPDVQIVGFHENIDRRDVINLTVEKEHEYFANGILVGNCHALLYALVGLQRYGGEQAKILGDSVWAGTPTGPIVTPQGELTVVGTLSPGEIHSERRMN